MDAELSKLKIFGYDIVLDNIKTAILKKDRLYSYYIKDENRIIETHSNDMTTIDNCYILHGESNDTVLIKVDEEIYSINVIIEKNTDIKIGRFKVPLVLPNYSYSNTGYKLLLHCNRLVSALIISKKHRGLIIEAENITDGSDKYAVKAYNIIELEKDKDTICLLCKIRKLDITDWVEYSIYLYITFKDETFDISFDFKRLPISVKFFIRRSFIENIKFKYFKF